MGGQKHVARKREPLSGKRYAAEQERLPMFSRRQQMWTRQHKSRNTGPLIVPAITLAVIGYFAFHAYQGEYGIYSKYRYEARAADLHEKLAALTDTRRALEHRVQLLRDGTLEKDMLDEQARRQLNVSRPNEITVLLPRSLAN